MEEDNLIKIDQLITLKHEDHYHSVKILGTFDNHEWEHLPMTLNKTQWEILLKLLVGKEYEFKFFANEQIWLCSNSYGTRATNEGFENNVLRVITPKKIEKVENSEEAFNSSEYNEEELNNEVLPILSPSNDLESNENQVSEDESEEFNEDEDINVNQFSFIKTEDELESELDSKPLNDSNFDNNNNLGPNLNEESNHHLVNDFQNGHNESTPLGDLGESWVQSMDMSTALNKEDLKADDTHQELDIAQSIKDDDQNVEKLLESETNSDENSIENQSQHKAEISETLAGTTEELKITESNQITQKNDHFESNLGLDTALPKVNNSKCEDSKAIDDQISDPVQNESSETSNFAKNSLEADQKQLEQPQIISKNINEDFLEDGPINDIPENGSSFKGTSSTETENNETMSKSGETNQDSVVDSSNSQNYLENSEFTTCSNFSTCTKITVTSGSGKTSEAPSPSFQTENLGKKSSIKKRSIKKKDSNDNENNEDDKKKQLAPKSFIWSLFDYFFLKTIYWALSWFGIKRQK